MTYGRYPYGGVAYAGSDVADIPADTETTLAVEIAFTTDPLSEPAWVDITPDVRSWSASRGRSRELERFQPGRATVVLSNLSAQYDSLNTAGPWFGNLKPMKRIRIRETFSGVTYPIFDGFVDKWQLNYPGKNKDAVAMVTATDAFKLFARTDLGRSVYANEVEADDPVLWWHLDEDLGKLRDGAALNSGSLGSSANGVFVASPGVEGQSLVVKDPGSSLVTKSRTATEFISPQGVFVDNANMDLLTKSVWSVEAWIRLDQTSGDTHVVWQVADPAVENPHAGCSYLNSAGDASTGFLRFVIFNSTFANGYGVQTASGSILPDQTHHVVCVVEPDGQMVIYLDGNRITTLATGAIGSNITGVTLPAGGDLTLAHEGVATPTGTVNFRGLTDEFAVYFKALTETRVDAHYAAGSAPWQGDAIKGRLDRILDLTGWPSALRELDVGSTTLQSADISDQTVLEHLQKAGETEYAGLLYMSRDGNVRFDDRTAVLAREPYPVVYGDTAGQIGYVDFAPDDGDTAIRNRAVISRLNGVAKVAEDSTSIAEFGRFTYTLEGLLSDSEQDSIDYAAFVVDQYKDQRRRIVQLELTTPVTGQEAVAYPAMLGPELGDAISVENNPLGGIEFTQVCAIEGIEHSGEPKNALRTTRFILSPEYPIRTLEDIEVATLGYAQVTASQTGITTITDLTSLTATVTVGSSRRVRVSANILTTRTVADGTTALYIREGSTTLQIINAQASPANEGVEACGSVVLTPSAGSHTYKLSLERSTGTGTVGLAAGATFPAFILVEDIGPA